MSSTVLDTMPNAREVMRAVDAAPQKPVVLLLTGRSGTGKSVLLDAARQRLRSRRVRVLGDVPTPQDNGAMLVIDDLHTMDPAQLDALNAEIASGTRSLLLATQPRPQQPALRALCATVARHGRTVELRALGSSDISSVARELGVSVPRPIINHIHTQTAGIHGGVVAGLLAAGTARLDQSIAAVDDALAVWARSQLSGADPALLDTLVVAATGTGLDAGELAEVLDIEPALAQDLLARARTSALVTDADLLLTAAVPQLRVLLGERRYVAVQRRLLDARLAAGLLRDHTGLLLAESGVRDQRLAEFLCRAAEHHRLEAARYYAAAVAAGADPRQVALPWADAAAGAGDDDTALRLAEPILDRPDAEPADLSTAVRICANVLTRRGLIQRAAALYRWLGAHRVGPDWATATTILALAGDTATATDMAADADRWPPTPAATGQRLIAQALLSSLDPHAAHPDLLQAIHTDSHTPGPCDPVTIAVLLSLSAGDPARATDALRATATNHHQPTAPPTPGHNRPHPDTTTWPPPTGRLHPPHPGTADQPIPTHGRNWSGHTPPDQTAATHRRNSLGPRTADQPTPRDRLHMSQPDPTSQRVTTERLQPSRWDTIGQPITSDALHPRQPHTTNQPVTSNALHPRQPDTGQPGTGDGSHQQQPDTNAPITTDQPVPANRPHPSRPHITGQPIIGGAPHPRQPDTTNQPVTSDALHPRQPDTTGQPTTGDRSHPKQPDTTDQPPLGVDEPHLTAHPFTARITLADAAQYPILAAWIALCTGDESLAADILTTVDLTTLTTRDRLLAHALAVGLARRGGDLPALRGAWSTAVLAFGKADLDLLSLLPVGELWLAGIEVGDLARVQPLVDAAAAVVGAVGNATVWTDVFHWFGVRGALAEEAPQRLLPHAHALKHAAADGDPHAAVLADAGRTWLLVRRGEVDPDAVRAAVRALAAAGHAFDGACLASDAARSVDDPAGAEAMRELAGSVRLPARPDQAVTSPDTPRIDPRPLVAAAALSDREREVAELVLLGLTYREIGARLYISAKTVEHHVARIRRRIGARSRSELLSILRAMGHGSLLVTGPG
ncbi:LuxR C-terminal-related transcriptional regulator [Nocardia sp. NPDC059177]|uniref:LuxR C-terminal-related transcriptional regulator n=1 Tax=Nocardia sp. NPDC059177 TaxID=3346759 RepID=UPI003678D32F